MGLTVSFVWVQLNDFYAIIFSCIRKKCSPKSPEPVLRSNLDFSKIRTTYINSSDMHSIINIIMGTARKGFSYYTGATPMQGINGF